MVLPGLIGRVTPQPRPQHSLQLSTESAGPDVLLPPASSSFSCSPKSNGQSSSPLSSARSAASSHQAVAVERQISVPAQAANGRARGASFRESRGSSNSSSTTASANKHTQLLSFTRRFTNPMVEPPDPTSAAAMVPLQAPATLLDASYHNLSYAGPVAVHWSHFIAFTTIGEKEASVLMFEKKANVKASSRLGKTNRLGLTDLLRYDVNQLTQLTHPRIVRVLNTLCETKDVIAFACEHIHQTLDRLLDPADAGGGVTLEKLEIKLGILQLVEGLSYLHNSVKLLHGNLTPSAVFITHQQLWKLGGFAFAVAAKRTENSYPCFPWTKRLPTCLQPDLDFLAPEYLDPNNHTVTTAADVWSMGVLICWIYAGGRRLIDVKSNLESYQIVVDQIDVALDLMTGELGANLRSSLAKVISRDVEQRPQVQMLALIKHFDDPPLTALRQLDDIAQEFDPSNKTGFLSHTLLSALPNIAEPLWFTRVLQRFNENFQDSVELFPSLLRPLTYMLNHCESHNIHKLRPWFRRIVQHAEEKALSQAVLDNLPVIFRRLNDEQVEDKCFDLIIFLLSGSDPHLKQQTLRAIPHMASCIPLWFINKRLLPSIQILGCFFDAHIPRQIDLLCAIAHLSDRCDSPTLHYLIAAASMCNALHPAIVHSKSRLVQRILTCDVSRLRDPLVIAHHLLNPLVLGLALPELSPAHFDDVMSSARILLDIVEQLRYESDEFKTRNENGRLCSRRVSMSSNHLPRLLITAARPSFGGGDGRKMSFLSADGRLEEAGRGNSRRESKDSRGSIESDVSLKIGNGSDISDDSALIHSAVSSRHSGGSAGGRLSGPGLGTVRTRRKSWLEGYLHMHTSLEQTTSRPVIGDGFRGLLDRSYRFNGGPAITHRSVMSNHSVERRPETRSPIVSDVLNTGNKPNRPNSFTNLGHNLACTLWKTFY